MALEGQQIVTREEARAKGLHRYFTGNPCRHGHLSERFVSIGLCLGCRAARYDPKKKKAYGRQHYLNNRLRYRENGQLWNAKNSEKRKRARARWSEANPEREKEVRRISAKKSYRMNPEKGRERARIWRIKNLDKAKALLSQWRKENPGKARAYRANRRARCSASTGRLTGNDIQIIIRRQKGRCAACKAKTKLQMDHIIPLALGGSSDRTNFQGLCQPCNGRKGAKHPVDFNRSRGLLL